MTSEEQILTRKEKNLLLAKKNYIKKKQERERLEKKNEELTNNQMSLLQEMSVLQSKLHCMKSILQEHEHAKNCSVQTFGKDGTPKRKWNATYHQEISSRQHHSNMRIKHEESRILMAR